GAIFVTPSVVILWLKNFSSSLHPTRLLIGTLVEPINSVKLCFYMERLQSLFRVEEFLSTLQYIILHRLYTDDIFLKI
ncbi:hypothetical protein SFRURICE_001314, partial [Spodoptera frugiperda]